MPDLTTHFLFGEQVIPSLPPAMQQMIYEHRAVFNYALQGPDILFFRKLFTGVFSGFSNLPKTGSRMHKEKVEETLHFMKSYIAQKADNQVEYEILQVYFWGFLCHYFLDSTVHPYVFFLIERILHFHPERTERSTHGRIEAELDSILYQYFHKAPVTTFSINEHFTIDIFSKNIVARMYVALLGEVYGVETEVGEGMKCFDDMRRVSVMLYDNSGILPNMRNVLGEVFPKTLDLTNQIKSKQILTDTANFNQNLWHHPKYPEITSHKSVLTLIQDAKQGVVPVLEEAFRTAGIDQPLDLEISRDFEGNSLEPMEQDYVF